MRWQFKLLAHRCPKSMECRAFTVPDPARPAEHGSILAYQCLQVPSMSSPVIPVWRAGRGNIVGELRPEDVRLGQWLGQGDSASGELCASLMRVSERRLDDDRWGAPGPDRGDYRRLGLCYDVDGDGLPLAEAYHAGDRYLGCARIGCSTRRSGSGSAHCCDDGILEVRARVNGDCLTGVKAIHAWDLDVGGADSRSGRQRGSGLRHEVGAVATIAGAIRESARAGGNGAGGSEEAVAC